MVPYVRGIRARMEGGRAADLHGFMKDWDGWRRDSVDQHMISRPRIQV
ncbi:hypothetical protein [Allokutzneria sp. NRRL B-24872]|nr:hypothetical protein [Allokutzneria sp. NRRL B-24872]